VLLLTYVTSLDERKLSLSIGADGPRRVWLNGELLYESSDATWAFELKSVPLTLRPGRNTLLVKASHATGEHYLHARLSDSLTDRAVELTARGLFADAAQLWNRLGEQTDSHGVSGYAALCAAAAGDEPASNRPCTGCSSGMAARKTDMRPIASSRRVLRGINRIQIRRSGRDWSSSCAPMLPQVGVELLLSLRIASSGMRRHSSY
jgi:hypothetical protein